MKHVGHRANSLSHCVLSILWQLLNLLLSIQLMDNKAVMKMAIS